MLGFCRGVRKSSNPLTILNSFYLKTYRFVQDSLFNLKAFKMESINNLIIRLIAIENFCKDIHYNSKGDSFYSKHLLADRIQENLSDYLDQIKEVCILGSDEKTLPSGEYLSRATSLIPAIDKSDRENFKRLENLIIDTLALLENMEDSTKGEENLYGAIAQDLQQSIGLIYRQVEI